MTLQEQIVEAWAKEGKALHTDEYIADNTSFAVGLLVGAGFPGAAAFVLNLGEAHLGHNHADMKAIRAKLGLPQ